MSRKTSPIPTTTTVESISTAISLTKVANWDGKSQEIHKKLITAFGAKDYTECIRNLRAQQIEPRLYINNLDKVSSYSIPKRLARFITIGGRSLTVSRPTQTLGDGAFEHYERLVAYMEYSPLVTRLLSRLSLLANDHSRKEGLLMFGDTVMRAIRIGSSLSKFFT